MTVHGHYAFVLWGGALGGAERHTVDVCRILRDELGVDAEVVFLTSAGRAANDLERARIPFVEIGLTRGREVLGSGAAVAQAVSRAGSDGAFLVYGGYLARALRRGGYRGTLVSIEHGGVLQLAGRGVLVQAKDRVSRVLGEHLLDATICVSDYVERAVERLPHAPVVRRIYNGVDVERYCPASPQAGREKVVFGYAGRLIRGKGIVGLTRAFEARADGVPCELRVAGDGPARAEAESVVAERGLTDSVRFLGVVDDMPNFWRGCDVAVHPTEGWRESFCLSVVEAMSCGIPAVVSDEGALPEIVEDGACGRVVPAGDHDALRSALRGYAVHGAEREHDGASARERARALFDVRRTARAYLELAEELRAAPGRRL